NSLKIALTVLRNSWLKFERPRVEHYLEQMLVEIGRVEHLLRSLRTFSAFEDVQSRPCSTRAVLSSLAPMVESAARERGIRQHIDLGDDLWAMADCRALYQALLNLVTNALDATLPAEGRVELRAFRCGPGAIALEVSDNGDGIPTEDLDEVLPGLVDGHETVYLPIGRWPSLDEALARACARLRRSNREGKTPPRRLGEVADLLGEERIIKDDGALASLRRAVDITAEAHVAAMRATRPGMWEYEIEALIEYEFRRRGSSGPGYGSIVGAGDNATILHYVDNRDALREGEVLLVDAGAEWDYFTGDITRAWPISGKFSGEQRAVYEVVLAANLAGIAKAVVGSSIDAIHEACVTVLCEGIAALGLIDASAEKIQEQGLYRRFYMHRTSHWLGVDVHDVGRYTLGGKPRPLAPGQVLTIEPGLYISALEDDLPPGFRGIGVRIEDDVLITEDGHEVLSAKAPKSVAAIEELMATR
ncbi:MAG: M24 family metallopeptidase, partial [Myxococcales bacterium]|nr:M24 family metallopeptidase [Myxococcales bacterium]